MGLTGVGPLDPSIQVPPPAPEIEPPPPPQMVRPEGIGGAQGMPPPPPPPQSFTPDPTVARLGKQLGQQYGQPVDPPPTPTKLRSILGGLVGMTRPGRAQAVGGHSLADLVTFGPSGIQQWDAYKAAQDRIPRPDQVAVAQGNLQAQAVGITRDNATAGAQIGANNALAGERETASKANEARTAVEQAKLTVVTPEIAARLPGAKIGQPIAADLVAEITKPPAQQQQRAITDNEMQVIASGGKVPGYEYISPEVAKAAIQAGVTSKLAAPHYETNEVTGVVTMLGQKEDGSYGVLWTSDKGVAMKRPPAASSAGGSSNDIKDTAQAIIAGQANPTLTAYSFRDRTALAAELHRLGYDQATAERDWKAVGRFMTSLNGAQQLRLQQATTFAHDSLDIVENLYSDLSKLQPPSGYKMWNKLALGAAKQLPGEAGAIANNLEAQINDLVSELATVYRGGNAATDEAIKLAAANLKAEWNPETFARALKTLRTTLTIRKNSVMTSEPMGVSPGSPYNPGIEKRTISTQEEWNKLPPGTPYIWGPSGQEATKPR